MERPVSGQSRPADRSFRRSPASSRTKARPLPVRPTDMVLAPTRSQSESFRSSRYAVRSEAASAPGPGAWISLVSTGMDVSEAICVWPCPSGRSGDIQADRSRVAKAEIIGVVGLVAELETALPELWVSRA